MEEEEDSSAKDVDGQRRRLGIELEANVVEGANTGPRAEAGGPGMAYPASATALNQHSTFANSIAGGTPPASNPNGHITGPLPAPAAPRPTDFSVSSLLTAASSHPPGILGGSSSQGSASPPPGGPGSPAAAPETPPPLPASGQRDLSHPSSAVAAASYFSAAALAAASFYGPAHLPPTSSPGPTAAAAHHLQAKGILAGAHHHPHLNPHGITPPGKHRNLLFIFFINYLQFELDPHFTIRSQIHSDHPSDYISYFRSVSCVTTVRSSIRADSSRLILRKDRLFVEESALAI